MTEITLDYPQYLVSATLHNVTITNINECINLKNLYSLENYYKSQNIKNISKLKRFYSECDYYNST